MTLRELNVKWIKEMMEFDQLCFPTDFWEERDWRSLLEDERAIYYALLDNRRANFCLQLEWRKRLCKDYESCNSSR